MNRFQSLFRPHALDLAKSLIRQELFLMEQGTPLGFILAFLNNVIMLFVFHALFVNRFLVDVPNPVIYLLLGIVQWNLYINVSMAGFGCFLYRQKIVMGYRFEREIMILARTAAVFIPYLLELTLILIIGLFLKIQIGWKIALLPVFLFCQYLFCAGICCLFTFIGVLHKNIIPFWNIMFRLLSFATPIFYIPVHFQSRWSNFLYSWNPFTIFMLWVRDLVNANGFPIHFNTLKIFLGSALVFTCGYALFRKMDQKVGDHL